jgi:hypothetical protein
VRESIQDKSRQERMLSKRETGKVSLYCKKVEERVFIADRRRRRREFIQWPPF